jgi:hypothetical protein
LIIAENRSSNSTDKEATGPSIIDKVTGFTNMWENLSMTLFKILATTWSTGVFSILEFERILFLERKFQFQKMKNDRHQGFARGHPPYYWPGLSTLNFLDLTG